MLRSIPLVEVRPLSIKCFELLVKVACKPLSAHEEETRKQEKKTEIIMMPDLEGKIF